MRHLIKRILKEGRQKDLSPKIKKLLQDSVKPNHKMICKIDVVAPDKMYEDPTGRDYQVMVSVIGGIGSKHWPMTQFVYSSRDKVINDVWHTVYDYMGLSTDVFLRNVKTCDEVMSESTIPNTVKRRANSKILRDYITNGEINFPMLCDDFQDGYEYADEVIDYAIDNFINEFEENLFNYNEDYYSDVMDYLRTLCRNEFGQELIDIYNTTCIENIKEESLNESKMMDYLKQFLSGEVLDNYRKEKGRKEFQKMVDMVYKITAKDHPIEGMVGVLVGHIDKNMWGTTYTDPNSVGSRWDFKVILKPLFTNYNPNNEQDYNDRVLKFEEDFNRNARGMGFETISPIQHEKITNYRVSFKWASRLDVRPID